MPASSSGVPSATAAGALNCTLTLGASDYGSAESVCIGVRAMVLPAGDAAYSATRTAAGVDVVLETGEVVSVREGGLDGGFLTAV